MKQKKELQKEIYNKKVVYSNEVVQHKKYKNVNGGLTATQKRIITYLISSIRPEDTEFHPVTLTFAQVYDLFGISYKGDRIESFKNVIYGLTEKCIEYEENGVIHICGWIDTRDIPIDTVNKTIVLKLNDKLANYYLQLKSRYSFYQIAYVMKFRNSYSQDIYDWCKIYANTTGWFVRKASEAIEDWTATYHKKDRTFGNLKQHVLLPVIDEINKYTDINISVKCKKGDKMYDITQDTRGIVMDTIWFYVTNKSEEELLSNEYTAIIYKQTKKEKIADVASKIFEDEMIEEEMKYDPDADYTETRVRQPFRQVAETNNHHSPDEYTANYPDIYETDDDIDIFDGEVL